MTSGRQRSTVFQEIRPEAGFKADDFVTGKFGGLPWNNSGEKRQGSSLNATKHVLDHTEHPGLTREHDL